MDREIIKEILWKIENNLSAVVVIGQICEYVSIRKVFFVGVDRADNSFFQCLWRGPRDGNAALDVGWSVHCLGPD